MNFKEIPISKTILAKLFAEEDISVIHAPIRTAKFDLASRTVYLPYWKDLSTFAYDLLVSHETGHALHTPLEGFHHISTKYKAPMRTYVNIVEDARIEKLQLRRYPGLQIAYQNGYSELFKSDFFGVLPNEDLSKRYLIDRLNLYFKLGRWGIIQVPFNNPLEKNYLLRVSLVTTFAEVEALSAEILAYDKLIYKMKKQQQKPQEKQDDQLSGMQEGGAGKQESDGGESLEESFEKDDNEGENGNEGSQDTTETGEAPEPESGESGEGSPDPDSKENTGETGKNEEPVTTNDAKSGDGKTPTKNVDQKEPPISDDEFESEADYDKSDEAFHESVDEMADTTQDAFQEVLFLNLPKIDAKTTVVSVDQVLERFNQKAGVYANNGSPERVYSNFVKRHKNSVNYLIKEFELRKAADEHKRTLTTKMGDLNMSKIHAYKFSEDIFRRADLVIEGKSHALMLVLDMSSSMQGIFHKTMEQLLILVEFCHRLNIPFEVYGFSDNYVAVSLRGWENRKFNPNNVGDIDISTNSFVMLQLISSTPNAVNYRKVFGYLSSYGYMISSDYLNQTSGSYKKRQMNPKKKALKNQLGPKFEQWEKDRIKEYATYTIGPNLDIQGTFDLFGTPLTQALYVAPALIRDLKKRTGSQIVHFVILTDGDGIAMSNYVSAKKLDINLKEIGVQTEAIFLKRSKIIFSDKETKKIYEYSFPDFQKELLKEHAYKITMNLLSKRISDLGCNCININLVAERNVYSVGSAVRRSVLSSMFFQKRDSSDAVEVTAVSKPTLDAFEKDGFAKRESKIYTHEFFLSGKTQTAEFIEVDDLPLTSKMTPREMAIEFEKTKLNTMNSRLLAVEFSKLISA